MDTRLRVGRAVGKNESEVAGELMEQLKAQGHPDAPPAIATDGKGSYREAMIETWGQVPEYAGQGRRPTHKQPQPGWQYLQVVKRRSECLDLFSLPGGMDAICEQDDDYIPFKVHPD